MICSVNLLIYDPNANSPLATLVTFYAVLQRGFEVLGSKCVFLSHVKIISFMKENLTDKLQRTKHYDKYTIPRIYVLNHDIVAGFRPRTSHYQL